jgi:hypothetical protein
MLKNLLASAVMAAVSADDGDGGGSKAVRPEVYGITLKGRYGCGENPSNG